jgi:hypothetical protein
VVTNINLINPIGALSDGNPIFSTAVNPSTRVDPRYNVINSTQSIGDSTYKNMTLQLTRRNVNGIGFDLAGDQHHFAAVDGGGVQADRIAGQVVFGEAFFTQHIDQACGFGEVCADGAGWGCGIVAEFDDGIGKATGGDGSGFPDGDDG